MSDTPLTSETDFWRSYRQEDTDRRVLYSKVGCLLSMVLVPAGSTLEYFVYPALFWHILTVRLACSTFIGIILGLHFTEFGRRHIRILGLAWIMVIPASINWMIYLTEGAMSPYYAGLNLVLLGAGVLLPWTFLETAILSGSTMGMYLLACFFHQGPPIEWSTFYNNLFFLGTTMTICLTSSYYGERSRQRDFKLRYELDRRNDELAESYKQLEELDRLKSDFFANVSHELRTPLTLIISPIEDLLREGDDLLDSTREKLSVARKNSLRLLKLINDLLEIIRLDEGKVQPDSKPIDLASFVPGLVESIDHMADMKGVDLRMRKGVKPLVVEGDESQLEKVFLNLLTNALKFTPEGGSVTASFGKEEGQAVVRVEDTGPGISDEDLQVIFDRFRQAEDSSVDNQGVGIGLALAKEIVEQHNGTLDAESEIGVGTTMRVALPLSDTQERPAEQQKDCTPEGELQRLYREADRSIALPEETPAAETDVSEEAGEATILVVDDEPDMRQFLVDSVAKEYRVVQAADGEAGLRLAKEEKPDLILLDLMLPGINGLEVCRRLKRNEQPSSPKIILLTAKSDEESKISALEYGADDFLLKPFSTLELRCRMENHLYNARLQQSLEDRNEELEETLNELRETESQLIQSEKMNAFGSVAAGLLHEINNPLNYTLTAVQMARQMTDNLPDDIQEELDDIEEGMTRVKNIVSDLRTFAYPETAEQQTRFDLSEAIEIAMRLTSHELKDIEVERNVPEHTMVEGAKTQLAHVVMNLLVNAADAVAECEQEEPHIRVLAKKNQDRVYISIQDNGEGIPGEKQDEIFEPFYTTKDVGEGTGLGLSISRSIVENHGGDIQLKSEVGEGSEFTFDVPLAKGAE